MQPVSKQLQEHDSTAQISFDSSLASSRKDGKYYDVRVEAHNRNRTHDNIGGTDLGLLSLTSFPSKVLQD